MPILLLGITERYKGFKQRGGASFVLVDVADGLSRRQDDHGSEYRKDRAYADRSDGLRTKESR